MNSGQMTSIRTASTSRLLLPFWVYMGKTTRCWRPSCALLLGLEGTAAKPGSPVRRSRPGTQAGNRRRRRRGRRRRAGRPGSQVPSTASTIAATWPAAAGCGWPRRARSRPGPGAAWRDDGGGLEPEPVLDCRRKSWRGDGDGFGHRGCLSGCLGVYGERSKQPESLTQNVAEHKKSSQAQVP